MNRYWYSAIISIVLIIVWIILIILFPNIYQNPILLAILFLLTIVIWFIIWIECAGLVDENPLPNQAGNHELQDVVQMNGRPGMRVPRVRLPPGQEREHFM